MQTETTPQDAESSAASGSPTELGRYETSDGERRIIVGRRVEGLVCVFDVAATDRTRGYRVDAGFASWRELAALVADYRLQAERLGRCPMSRAGIAAMLRAGRAS